jgi:hypothetical protein
VFRVIGYPHYAAVLKYVQEHMMTGHLDNFVKRFSRRFRLSGGNGPPPEGANLARMIVSAYLSRADLDDVEGSCPLIGLPTDAARGGATVKAAFAEILEIMVSAFSSQLGPDRKAAHEKALGIAALCVGGMVLARGRRSRNGRRFARGRAQAGRHNRRLGGATCRTGTTPWATVVGRPHGLIHFRVPIIMALLAVLGHTLTTDELVLSPENRAAS